MRSGNRNLTIGLLCAATMVVPCAPLLAQTVQKPAAEAAKKDPNVALKALDAGGKAYSAGKLEPAIQSLTAALSNGGLPPQKMAQAYYYRGMAYKKQKKPAQALSDLTVAVWVNGGLNEADRASAMDARNEVYREAGLGDQAPPIANAVGTPSPKAAVAAAPTPPPAATPAPAAPAPAVAPVAKAPPPAADSFATAVSPAAQPPAAPQVAAADPSPAARPVWQADPNASPPPPMPLPVEAQQSAVQPSGTGAPVATLSPQPNSAPPAASAPSTGLSPATALAPAGDETASTTSSNSPDIMAPLASAGSSISGFFSNMFGQGGQKEPAPQAQATGSTGPGGEQLGWAGSAASPQGPSVQVSASEPQRAPGYDTPSAPPSAAATAKSVVTSANGKYRLQLASVRSREEADRLAATVMSTHANELGGAAAEVDETVIGNMGTFYRVRVGPYANANEPRKLCGSLKPQGYDCQVVTQ